MRVLPPTFFAIFSYWSIGLHTKCVACVLLFTGMLLCPKPLLPAFIVQIYKH